MITIKQQATVPFSHVDVQDVVTMLSLMDKTSREYREAYSRKDRSESAYSEYRKLGLQLLTLHKLGFCTSDPRMLQWDLTDFPEAKELEERFHSEKKAEEYRPVKSNQSTGLSIVPPTRHEE